jgi:tetratricopeptide (TPR) repeat protein
MTSIVSKLAIVAAVTLMAAEVGFCIDSPVGSPTAPATSTQSGLIPSTRGRNINAGNEIVTGNVGAGKAFQGIVPYGSTYYFQGTQGVGVSDVDTFIRNSTGSSYATDRSPGVVQPYYSPFRSVSSLSSRSTNNYGISDSSALQVPRMSPYRQPLTFGLVPLAEAQKLQQQNAPLFQPQNVESQQEQEMPLLGQYRPLSTTPLEMQQYISEQITGKLYPTEQQEQAGKEQKSALENVPQIAQPKEGNLELAARPEEPFEPTKVYEPALPGQKPEQLRKEVAKTPGVFEQMLKAVHDEFVKNLEKMKAEKQALAQAEANQPVEPNAQAMMQPETAKAILGYSTTFATQATDRFNILMKAAEGYMKDKQYYKAADAYSLAVVYQRNNPLPYAGKANALFGAGEYMSSAYFLSRAIELFPDYPRFKVDLVAMLGDKDILEKRTTDIIQWQERTGSPELQFLLAYIYLQTDRLELAQRMTNGALVLMPQSRALQILDKVIRLAIEERNKTGKP